MGIGIQFIWVEEGERLGNVGRTFANIRLLNKMARKVGPYALHVPGGDEMSVFEAAMKYKSSNHQCVVIAGAEYS